MDNMSSKLNLVILGLNRNLLKLLEKQEGSYDSLHFNP